MIVCCLCPFIGRYFKSTPFGVQSWYYYKNVYDFADRLDRVAFCGYEKNFPTPEDLKKQKIPVFLSDFDKKVWRYEILDQKVYEKTNKTFVPPDLMARLVRECGGSVFQAWRKVMTEAYPPLVDFYRNFLKKCAEKEPLEFIRATANDASMSAAAAEFKVPFVHYEKGPLRSPDYLETAYWDLSGVNGSTECEARRQAAGKPDWKELELSREELLFLFCADNDKFDARTAALPQDADAGVAGQVDDDSNVIAYSNGFSNFEAIQYAENLFPNGKVIVRRHPTARTLCAGEYDVDQSVYHFIRRTGLVISINSSVSLETVLMGKNAIMLGDSPFRTLSSQIRNDRIVPPDDPISKLNFILLNYLVPVPAVDTLEYTQWRLSGPSELEIRKRHLAEFLRIRGFKDLKHFRKTFQEYHPARRKEVAGPLVMLEPVSIVQREKDYMELAGLHRKLHEQHTDLEQRHKTLCEQHADLEQRHGAICERHADLEKRHNGLFQQYNDLGRKFNHLSSQHGELEQQFNDLYAQFASLKDNYHSLCERHADLEKRHGAICARHADLEKRHNALYRQYSDAAAALKDSLDRFGMQSRLLNEIHEKHTALQQDLEQNLPQLRQLCSQYSELKPEQQCRKFHDLWLQFINGRQEQLKTENQYRQMELRCHELTLKIQDLELLKNQFLSQIESLSGQLDAISRFSAEAKTEQLKSNEELKQKYDALSEQFSQLDRQNKNLNGRYTTLELQLENIRGQNSVLEQKFDTLDHVHQELLKQHETLLAQHNGLLQNYQHLTEIHQALKLDHDNLTQAHHQLILDHQTLTAGHAALEQSFGKLGNVHAGLKDSYDRLNQKYAGLEQEYHNLDQNHAVLKSDYDRLLKDCGSLKKQHQELDAAHQNLKNENSVLQQVHSAQSRVLSDLKSKQEQLLRDYSSLDAANQELNREHAVLNEKFSRLNSVHDQLTKDHAVLQQEYDALTQSHAVLEYRHNELNRSHADLTGNLDETRKKYLSECSKNSELEKRLAELQKQYQALTENTAELEKKNLELTSERNRLYHSHAWRLGSAVVRPFQKVHLLTDREEQDDNPKSESKS